MNKIINYLKSISLFLILFLIYLLIISLIYYLEILSYNTVSIINYIVILLLFFVLGFKTSSLERSKGYLNGFIVSTSICILFSIITLFISKYSFGALVYYLSLILSSITGGIIGVTKNSHMTTFLLKNNLVNQCLYLCEHRFCQP